MDTLLTQTEMINNIVVTNMSLDIIVLWVILQVRTKQSLPVKPKKGVSTFPFLGGYCVKYLWQCQIFGSQTSHVANMILRSRTEYHVVPV
jgi:hypothetical protein